MKKSPPARRPRASAAGAETDPYKSARRPARASTDKRPARAFSSSAGAGARRPARFERSSDEAPARRSAPRAPRRDFDGGEEGFTVRLDNDVARVFRGDASVNKALRMVLQLVQIVQGPPRSSGFERGGPSRSREPGGYRGSSQARGFERKPRFEDDDEE